MPVITLKRIHHRGRDRIGLYFKYNRELINQTKKLEGAAWSATKKCWYITESYNTVQELFKHYNGVARLDSKIHKTIPTNEEKAVTKPIKRYKSQLTDRLKSTLASFRNYMEGKRYSPSTVHNYLNLLELFFGYFHTRQPDEITYQDIDRYNYDIIVSHNYSVNYQRQLVNALKLFYKYHNNIHINIDQLERPKREKKLPTVLSRQEVLRILMATTNLKHRAILSLLYGTGLRISELIHLQVRDIDFNRRQVHIRGGKGKKDRVVTLPIKIEGLLKDYLLSYQPNTYMFNGQESLQYSAGSVRNFLRATVKKAGIKKKVTPHTLRHTYATHMLESGVNLKYVQELLGHSKPETTQIYLHISQKRLLTVNSPLDTLLEEARKEGGIPDNADKNLLLSGENDG